MLCHYIPAIALTAAAAAVVRRKSYRVLPVVLASLGAFSALVDGSGIFGAALCFGCPLLAELLSERREEEK